MQKHNATFLKILFLFSFVLCNLQANITPKGNFTGQSEHGMPQWFKESFMEFEDDVEEAADQNKHVMLFMTLQFCPYCTKMLDDNFVKGAKQQPYIQENFDVIGIDIRGSREIVVSEELTMTEKEYAADLNVQYTPTIIFLDQTNKIVARVNGYRSATNFKYILDFVKNKEYKNMTMAEYIEKVKNKTLYTLQENPMFKKINDLSKIDGPLAVVFEDGSCTQCEYLHNITLKNKEVVEEMGKFTVVRFDTESTQKIITPSGKTTTAKKWARDLTLDYRPGVILFDDKIERSRIDALLYSFHFKEQFRFVSQKEYENFRSYLDYLGARQKELLNNGIDIDISDK